MDNRPALSVKWKILETSDDYDGYKKKLVEYSRDESHWILECDSIVATDVFALAALSLRYQEPLIVIFNGASDTVFMTVSKDKCDAKALAEVITQCSENHLDPEELEAASYLRLVPDDSELGALWDA